MSSHNTPKKSSQAVDLCSRAGAGAATTAANDAGAGASTATGENFGVTTVDDAAAPDRGDDEFADVAAPPFVRSMVSEYRDASSRAS